MIARIFYAAMILVFVMFELQEAGKVQSAFVAHAWIATSQPLHVLPIKSRTTKRLSATLTTEFFDVLPRHDAKQVERAYLPVVAGTNVGADAPQVFVTISAQRTHDRLGIFETIMTRTLLVRMRPTAMLVHASEADEKGRTIEALDFFARFGSNDSFGLVFVAMFLAAVSGQAVPVSKLCAAIPTLARVIAAVALIHVGRTFRVVYVRIRVVDGRKRTFVSERFELIASTVGWGNYA